MAFQTIYFYELKSVHLDYKPVYITIYWKYSYSFIKLNVIAYENILF